MSIGLVLGLLAGCASDEPAASAPDAELVESRQRVDLDHLARTLGLRGPADDDGHRVILQGHGRLDRVLLFPGTTQLTVRGSRLSALDPVRREERTVTLSLRDARRIGAAWRAAGPLPVASLPPAVSAPPPVPHSSPRAGPPADVGADVLEGLSIAERATWAVPLTRDWDYIVIHHSATADGNAARFHQSHLARGWDGLGYDFVIGNGRGSRDGQIEVGYRWTQQKVGAHAGNDLMNQHGIGICLVGDFTKTRPTRRQMASLQRLCDFLAGYCGIPAGNLRRHRDVRDTQCPGPLFPADFRVRPAAAGRLGRR